MKINIYNLLYIPLILFFLPSFSFYIPGLNVYPVFFFAVYFLLLILFSKNTKQILVLMKNILKKTPAKIIIAVFFLIVLNSVYLSLSHYTTIYKCVKSIFFRFVLCYGAIFVYFSFVISRYIPYKKFMTIFIFLFWNILILGFFAYIGQLFDIEFINHLFEILANKRFLEHSFVTFSTQDTQASNYIANGLPRLDNICDEPAFYARFLFLFMPLLFAVSSVKQQIFKNIKFDIIVKKTLIPFIIISIILTQSPIYLILTLMLSLVYFRKKITNAILRYNIIIATCFIIFIPILSSINWENTYFYRIYMVIQSCSIEELVYAEPSLSSRIVSFYNTFQIFLAHPLNGVGIGNVENYQLWQLLHSKIPLTWEITKEVAYANTHNTVVSMNTALFYYFLASHGIIIFVLFMFFHIKLYKELNYLSKFRFDAYSNSLIYGFKWCWISITILMFYHTRLIHMELVFLYTLIIVSIYYYKNKIYKEIIQK